MGSDSNLNLTMKKKRDRGIDKTVAEFIDRHPDIDSKHELARMLYAEYPHIFKSEKAAASAVRRVTGTRGNASLSPDHPYYREWVHDGQRRTKAIDYKQKYAYNSATDDYVFFTEKLTGKYRVLKGPQVKSILDRYSNFDGNPDTLNQIALKFGLRREEVIFVLRALGITHDSLPFTNEMIAEGEPEQLVDDLFIQKRNVLHERYTKRQWDEIQENAEKWQNFEAGTLNPIREFLEAFKPAKEPAKIKAPRAVTDRAFMVTVCDLHFGANSDKEELFYGEEWNIDRAEEVVRQYTEEIGEYLQSINCPPCKIYLVIAHDIIHSLTGYTTKGTKLENSFPLGPNQLLYAQRALQYQIEHLLNLQVNKKNIVTDITVVATVGGNHDAIADWTLVQLLKNLYSHDGRVSFIDRRTRWVAFEVFGNLFCVEHGASPYYKSLVPKGGDKRKAYIQDVLMQAGKEFPNAKHRYFLTADQHNLEHSESNHFEFIRFSSPMHDRYADHLNLHSRPRQTMLEVRPEGVKADIHFFFDRDEG